VKSSCRWLASGNLRIPNTPHTRTDNRGGLQAFRMACGLCMWKCFSRQPDRTLYWFAKRRTLRRYANTQIYAPNMLLVLTVLHHETVLYKGYLPHKILILRQREMSLEIDKKIRKCSLRYMMNAKFSIAYDGSAKCGFVILKDIPPGKVAIPASATSLCKISRRQPLAHNSTPLGTEYPSTQ